MGGGEFPVLADGALGPSHAGGVDQRAKRTEIHRGVDRIDDLLGVGDVDLDEHAADLTRELLAAFDLHVGDDDLGAEIGQLTRGGGTDARCPTSDDCTSSIEFHVAELTAR